MVMGGKSFLIHLRHLMDPHLLSFSFNPLIGRCCFEILWIQFTFNGPKMFICAFLSVPNLWVKCLSQHFFMLLIFGVLLCERPPEVSAAEAVGLPIVGATALQTPIDVAGTKLDKGDKATNVLITAASGVVGHYAVQLAKLGSYRKKTGKQALNSQRGARKSTLWRTLVQMKSSTTGREKARPWRAHLVESRTWWSTARRGFLGRPSSLIWAIMGSWLISHRALVFPRASLRRSWFPLCWIPMVRIWSFWLDWWGKEARDSDRF